MKTNKKKKRQVKKTLPKADKGRFRKSKSPDFLEKFKNSTAMAEYFYSLRIMNLAADRTKSLSEPRREGSFVRLAHAREEFTAPVLTKGKSVQRAALKKRKKS
jgi:hypothetical protein